MAVQSVKASRRYRKGAYFTTLAPGTKKLGKRLFLRGCKDKLKYVFVFSGGQNLKPLEGDRGKHIFYSDDDYLVVEDRQIAHGPTAEVQEKLK